MTTTNNNLIEGIILEKVREIKTELFDNLVTKFEDISHKSSNIEYTNLKLRNASYYLYTLVKKGVLSDKQASNLFEHLCECEYEYFQEWEQENLSDVSRHYIGHTSSFYYNTNIELYYTGSYIQDILEGKDISLEDITGDLDSNLHDLLFENSIPEALNTIRTEYIEEVELDEDLTLEDFLEDIFSSSIEILEELDNELDEMNNLIDDALKGYDYLKDFKSEENEISLVNDYLEIEIYDIISPEKSENVYDELISELSPLNKLTWVDLSVTVNGNEYVIICNSNIKTVDINTGILTGNKLSENLINSVLDDTKELFNKNFEF